MNSDSAIAAKPATISKTTDRVLWALQILAALAFLGAGASKLMGTKDMVALFDAIGQGSWLRYFTGASEVVGAIALLVPGWARFGALNLAGVMVGAVATHLIQIGGNPAPPLVLLALVAAIAWGRRYQSLRPWQHPVR